MNRITEVSPYLRSRLHGAGVSYVNRNRYTAHEWDGQVSAWRRLDKRHERNAMVCAPLTLVVCGIALGAMLACVVVFVLGGGN